MNLSGLCSFDKCPYEASYFCSRGRHFVCVRHIPELLDNRCDRCRQLDGSYQSWEQQTEGEPMRSRT